MKSYNEIKEILLRDYPKYFDILDLDMQIRGLFGVDEKDYKKQLDRNLDNYMDCSKRVANNEGLRDHDWLKQEYERLLNIYNDIKKTYKEADNNMNLYKAIKSNLNESEEVKCKVTFECSECEYEFSKKFDFDSEEEAEEVFNSDADIDCPKCGGHAYPKDMEYIGDKKQDYIPQKFIDILNKLISDGKIKKDYDGVHTSYVYYTGLTNEKAATKMFNNDVLKLFKDNGFIIGNKEYNGWTYISDSNKSIARFRIITDSEVVWPNPNEWIGVIILDNNN